MHVAVTVKPAGARRPRCRREIGSPPDIQRIALAGIMAADRVMWSSIFGPGWIWGLFVALALLCFVLGAVGFARLVMKRPSREAGREADRLWQRWGGGGPHDRGI